MIGVSQWIDISKVFLNSLLFSGVLSIFTSLIIVTFISLLKLVKPIDVETSYFYIIAVLGTLGFALLMTARLIIETKKYARIENRFKRSHRSQFHFSKRVDLSKLKELLARIGYIQLGIEENNNAVLIQGTFPAGVYSYPKEAGGYKKYEEKYLQIKINLDLNLINIEIGPSRWYIPTAFVYSNNYYLQKLESEIWSLLEIQR